MSTVNKYPKPVPAAQQRRARLRRVRQQWRLGRISDQDYETLVKKIEKETK